MAMFAIDFGMRQTFGYAYYDLPGYANEAEQGMYRYESIRTTGYDPAFGIYRGDVTVNGFDAQGNQTSSQTVRNPTAESLARIVAAVYLQASGLSEYIVGSMTQRGGGWTLNFDRQSREAIFKTLDNTAIFLSGSFGRLHKDDVGGNPHRDYRSITGTLGPRSLQVVVNTRTLAGYADPDGFNPYQDARGFFGHTFLELVPNRLRRVFGGRR